MGPATVDNLTNELYLDFRRGEPNNLTESMGRFTAGGERCVRIVPWQTDPLIVEQGSWDDDACQNQRPFICQVFAPSLRHTLTVTSATTITGGSLLGGHLQLLGPTTISSFTLLRSAQLFLRPNGSHHADISSISLNDASRLYIQGNITVYRNSFLGELPVIIYEPLVLQKTVADTSGTSPLYAQSLVLVTSTGFLTFACRSIGQSPLTTCLPEASSTITHTVQARVEVQGGLMIGNSTVVKFLQVCLVQSIVRILLCIHI